MTRLSLRSSFRDLTASRVTGLMTAVTLLLGSTGAVVSTAPAIATPAAATAGAAEKRVVDDRTIAHVLNRMAFGPRQPHLVESIEQLTSPHAPNIRPEPWLRQP